MGSVPSSVKYDFLAARKRITELTGLYRLAKHTEDEMAQWLFFAEIDEIEREIAEAHENSKMAVGHDGHSAKHIKKIIAPIVPQWAGEHKGQANDNISN